jgi:ubiquinone/menaquinone biosynthesis C-methylase UbiE
MDYDATDIASNYDLGRSYSREVLDLWMSTVASYTDGPVNSILDLGCGTGRFSGALAVHFNAEVTGIDPSKKMLEQARSKQTDAPVRYQFGRAEAIPLPDESVDLVFMSMIFHHLEDPALAARECRRVLRDRGTAFLRAGTRERISTYPYVDFFPASRPVLECCLAKCADICRIFETAGFRTVAVDAVTQEVAPSFQRYAEKISAGADSVLASLSQSDFEAGLAALRSHAIQVDNQAVFEPIDVFVFR